MPKFSQTASGRSWEYGLARQLVYLLNRTVAFDVNAARGSSQKAYEQLPDRERFRVDNAAKEAVTFLWAHDQRLEQATKVSMQSDVRGQLGDVRDILVETPSGMVGISAKHRHDALKHPRLSDKIDFGKKWYAIPCSSLYWQTVKPIFADLRNRSGIWKDLPNKEAAYYLPVLTAFIREVKDYADSEKLLRYLLGIHDFYKIIKNNSSIVLQSFNINGSLHWGKTLPLPSKIVNIDMDSMSNTTAILHMDRGWQLSFRIHNASSRIEPSLKFDVRLIGSPEVLVRHEIPVH